ncbi:hypothetical protein WS62_25360 [Burkholderia sp. ABCPW 14]|nr:hypothetical protein WS62_25360 [Burkholderia sp. ABCPW 14]
MDTANTNEKFTIAVIGGGAASVAFLHHFTRLVTPSVAARIRIEVFEPRPSVGPGLAYGEDVGALLLNRAVETMSVSASDFSTFASWVRWKSHHEDDLNALAKQDLSATYVSRPLFGRYLCDFFQETRSIAHRKGLAIDVRHHAIRSIERSVRYRLDAGERIYEADSVIVAIGNTGQKDLYGLDGHPCYISTPYPLSQQLLSLAAARRICIIGASLTAVDVAVSLHKFWPDVEIHMVSPTGTLPYVKGKQVMPRPLRFLTEASIRALTSGGARKIGLRALTRLLRAEFNAIGEDWRHLFARHDDAVALLHDEIEYADRERAWQTILVATNGVVEQAWNALDPDGQALFLRRFARQWLARRAPMPLDNAKVLARMLDDKRLAFVKTPVVFDRTARASIRLTGIGKGSSDAYDYDYVVNATGSAKDIDSPAISPLGWQMLRDGLAVPDWRGGIQVDFDTGAILDRSGEPDWQLRALGHITCGTYFYVSSLEMVAKRACKIAGDIVSALSENVTLRPLGKVAA